LKILCFIQRREKNNMINLILKDLMIQKTNFLILFLTSIAYLAINTSVIWLGFIFSIIVIMNAFAMDEKTPINQFLNALPYTRKQIVSAKYIGVFVFTMIILSFVTIGNLIIHQTFGDWRELLLIFCLVLLFVSYIFPFSYKFSSRNLITGSVISVFVVVIALKVIGPKDTMTLNEKIGWVATKLFSLQQSQLYIVVGIVISLVYICSWMLSIRIYSKKVL